jgi:hypothetical protein
MYRRSAFAFMGLFAVLQAAEVPGGTHLLLRMTNSISTRTAQEGDYVYLRTGMPLVADGRVVAPAGSYVQGVVSHARRSGRISGRAELSIRLETMTLPGGRSFRFAPRLAAVDSEESGQKVDRSEGVIRQAPERGRDAARIAILAGSGASIGGIADRSWRGAGIGAGAGGAVGLASVLLSRGREVDLRRGSTLDVVFERPVTLE